MSGRKMPKQKPGDSEQDVQTPPEFLRAVEKRFGAIKFDLAAKRANAVVPDYFGPGSSIAEDALAPTTNWQRPGLLWLNPPFGMIQHFAARCRRESVPFGPKGKQGGVEIVMLGPAAVCTEWFNEHVYLKARVIFLRPRVVFIGQEHGFPMGLMLAHFGPKVVPGFDNWRWDEKA